MSNAEGRSCGNSAGFWASIGIAMLVLAAVTSFLVARLFVTPYWVSGPVRDVLDRPSCDSCVQPDANSPPNSPLPPELLVRALRLGGVLDADFAEFGGAPMIQWVEIADGDPANVLSVDDPHKDDVFSSNLASLGKWHVPPLRPGSSGLLLPEGVSMRVGGGDGRGMANGDRSVLVSVALQTTAGKAEASDPPAEGAAASEREAEEAQDDEPAPAVGYALVVSTDIDRDDPAGGGGIAAEVWRFRSWPSAKLPRSPPPGTLGRPVVRS